jgi:hypothetical protein
MSFWHSNVIFAEFEIDKSDFEAFSRPFKIAQISIKKIFKKSVYEHYEKQLTEKPSYFLNIFLIEIWAILNGLLKASKSLLSISNSANISFAKVYHIKLVCHFY